MSTALAIETSGRVGSVAIVRDGQVLIEEQFAHGLQNAAKLLPIIDRLCANHGVWPTELSDLYISIGPGSFTGLRMGCTRVKTVAFATGETIVAVASVDSLVRLSPLDWRHSIIVLDAKRDQIFTASFRNESGKAIEHQSAQLGSIADMLARTPRPVHMIGEGIPYHRKFIPDDPGIIITSTELWRSRAATVAEIGMEMRRAGRGIVEPDRLAPLYIRLPEAEEKWRAAHAV